MNTLERLVRVIFRGEDNVSPAANSAEKSVGGFGATVSSVVKSLGALGVGVALGAFFKKAVEEASNAREAMGQLSLAVDNSGASFTAMEPEIEAALDRLSRLTKFSDDDFAKAMDTMTTGTGDARWALDNLGLVADLAAKKSITLEESANAVTKAHEGNTKTLFALIPELKGAANWQELLAQKTHGAAEEQLKQLGPIGQAKKMFGEFAEEVGKAILGNDDFQRAGFTVVGMLGDLAKWTHDNAGEIGKFTTAIVVATSAVAEGLVPVMRLLKGVGGPVLVYIRDSVAEAGFMFQAFSGLAGTAVGIVVSALGVLVEKGGKFLKVFGIEAVEATGKSMVDAGTRLLIEGRSNMEGSKRDWIDYQARMKEEDQKGVDDKKKKREEETVIVKDALGKQEDEYDAYVKHLKQLYKLIDDEVVSYKERVETLGPAVKKAMETGPIEGFNRTLAASKEEADKAVAAMKEHGALPPLVKKTELAVKDVADALVQSARTALDVAQAFGKIDSEAAAAFTSAINVGDAVSKMMTGGVTFAGVTGVIGGVANIVSQMMQGDAERKRLLGQNNDRLRELRDEIGNLDLNITGEDFAKVTSALTSAVPNLLGGIGNRGADLRTLSGALSAQGLTFGDLDRIAKEIGIEIRDKSGGLNFDAVKQLLAGLKDVEFGQFGQDFASQLRAAMSGFSINGTSDAGQIGGLGALGAQFSPLLRSIFNPSDLAGSRTRLQEAFARMQPGGGGFSARELGGLTGNQFLDFITDLIGRIDRLGGASNGTPGLGGIVGLPDTGMPTLPGPDVGLPATLTNVVDSITGFHEEAVPLLSQSLDVHIASLEELRGIRTAIERSGMGGTSDAAMGRRLAVDRRLAGNPAL